ncbi:type III secretion system chaperone [Erwinia tracheiphila]|uniref:type III secretion system chaperone n=1 Tax=Erwinia tracheiphila TaxID=65700 RepID=UPI001F29F74F|nr:type III secretion system chaperone [Erwinia tracheiphila]UIA84113.1 type III secretion system chaperone [Erwinia tracheiphila]
MFESKRSGDDAGIHGVTKLAVCLSHCGLSLSAAHGSVILADILAANLFHFGTSDGAAFGLDQEKDELLLFQRFQLPAVDEDLFVNACVQMIEVTKVWQSKLMHSRADVAALPPTLMAQGLTLKAAGRIR